MDGGEVKVFRFCDVIGGWLKLEWRHGGGLSDFVKKSWKSWIIAIFGEIYSLIGDLRLLLSEIRLIEKVSLNCSKGQKTDKVINSTAFERGRHGIESRGDPLFGSKVSIRGVGSASECGTVIDTRTTSTIFKKNWIGLEWKRLEWSEVSNVTDVFGKFKTLDSTLIDSKGSSSNVTPARINFPHSIWWTSTDRYITFPRRQF